MKTIPQRELRNHSGEILRKAERGQEFVVTVDGRPVAQLGPCAKRPWLRKRDYLACLRGAGDGAFFADIHGMGRLDLDAT